MTTFYLGAHHPHWLHVAGVPLFVSHRRLAGRRSFPRAAAPWALDSGGYTELAMYGAWRTTTAQYAAAVRRYRDEIGHLDWAAPMDWVCTPPALAATGLSVAEHQRRTLTEFLRLRDHAPELDVIPALQGWHTNDFLRHADTYRRAGVDLAGYPVVGVGSVARRQHTPAAAQIFADLAAETGLALHGFGVKLAGLLAYGHHVVSADSMAWSATGRYLPGCAVGHRTEANCLRFALAYRADLLARLAHAVRPTGAVTQ
ncbi:MAG TPA: hypothetical protein VK453_11915 [Micromonosporaceae bacterium]|nr:hypothetical protein [Micromonosporaceae bacterium]